MMMIRGIHGTGELTDGKKEGQEKRQGTEGSGNWLLSGSDFVAIHTITSHSTELNLLVLSD